VRFGAGGTTYDVWDVTAAAAVSAGNAYTAGQTITVAGMAFEVKGAPAAGDKFTLAPSQVASVFDRLSRAIAALEDGATGPAASARLTNELGVSLQGLDRALDRVLDARGAAGNALNRLDTLTGLSQDREVATSAQLSAVEDLDYAKAASELTLRTTALEAALAAYSQTAKRSLFDYL
jgi:flagellar hook-associated protein 3 FlgL